MVGIHFLDQSRESDMMANRTNFFSFECQRYIIDTFSLHY